MFKSKFHYALDTDNGLVTVRPTNGTILKAFLPSVIPMLFFGAMYVIATIAESKSQDDLTALMDTLPDEEK